MPIRDPQPPLCDTAPAASKALIELAASVPDARIESTLKQLLRGDRRLLTWNQVFLRAHHLVWSSGKVVLHTMCIKH